MSESVTIDFSKPIPLFPLGNCALLPHAAVPLHVFEPRYRDMVRDTLDGSGLIAMAMFAGDAWKQQYLGNPPLREHVCVGHIVRHQRLDDGRYNILLQGICRARIEREVEPEQYRKALLEPIETQATMEIDLSERRERLEHLLEDPALEQLAAIKSMQNWISGELPTAALVDLATLTLCQDGEERYRMLAEPDVDARAAWLEHYLRDTRRTIRLADRQGPAVSEDGFPLN